MSEARALRNEPSMGDNNRRGTPVILHRCVRVVSLAALLIIVPAGVFAQDVDAMASRAALTVVRAA
jgi:hypothetical protein